MCKQILLPPVHLLLPSPASQLQDRWCKKLITAVSVLEIQGYADGDMDLLGLV